MPAPTLSTPAARIELRDLATATYCERFEALPEDHVAADRLRSALASTANAVTDLGFVVTCGRKAGSSCAAWLEVTATDGSSLYLYWDPMLDGFDYEGSGEDGCDLDEIEANTEDEPETVSCDGCGEDDAEDAGEGFAFCAACRAKDAATPRIDMVPSNVHLVEVDIDEDDIDRLGNYIGYGIESYDTVRQCDTGWWLIRIESVGRTTIAGILDDLDAVRHYHFRDRA